MRVRAFLLLFVIVSDSPRLPFEAVGYEFVLEGFALEPFSLEGNVFELREAFEIGKLRL